MLAVDVLRAEDLRRVPGEDVSSDFAQIHSSNDSDKVANKSPLITEGIDNSSQTDYIAKMKNKQCVSHGQKPYNQLSDIEKQRLMERQSRKLLRLREERRRYGINRSISHLGKDDGVKCKENGVVGPRRRENSTCSVGSMDSCDDLSSSLEDEEDLERNLESWYQAGCGEDNYVIDKSRWDLVKNYMDMEDKVEELQKSLRETRLQQSARRAFNVEAEMEKIRVFRDEIELLMRENDVLQIENDKLRLMLPSKED